MARVLITGASGFIGKHLSAQLSKTHKVTELPKELLYNFEKLRKFLRQVNPDYIYHLAAYGNKYDQQQERQILNANITALFNLLFASKSIHYKALINFSSSSTLLNYETFYSAAKGAGERLVKAFVNKYDKPVVTVRPASIYGKGDHSGHFIPTAIKSFKENLLLRVAPGDHDWLYIDDLISGVLKVAENVNKLQGQCVNISSGQNYSNYGVISILQDIFDKHGLVQRIEQVREYDTKNWCVDNSLLKSFGWIPEIDLEEGLERLVYGK